MSVRVQPVEGRKRTAAGLVSGWEVGTVVSSGLEAQQVRAAERPASSTVGSSYGLLPQAARGVRWAARTSYLFPLLSAGDWGATSEVSGGCSGQCVAGGVSRGRVMEGSWVLPLPGW